MKQHLPIKMGGVIAALILLSIAVGAILSGSPGISAQAVTTTPTPIDAIPRPVDAIPRPIQTTATPTPSLIPTSNSTISTPVPRTVQTAFTASATEGRVSITLNDVTNIEWVQVWVGTPDLNTTLHLGMVRISDQRNLHRYDLHCADHPDREPRRLRELHSTLECDYWLYPE